MAFTKRPTSLRHASVGANVRKPDLVRCWMAHHQGMSFLSLANFLCDGVVQRWFHADPRVQATELLLHEKPLSHTHMREAEYENATA